ncbi:MAG: hypothetical protein VB024_04500 [Dysgonamonadaceae bacterium]|nr:hypothetical protein [Dysgonamonadaceae bacterium]
MNYIEKFREEGRFDIANLLSDLIITVIPKSVGNTYNHCLVKFTYFYTLHLLGYEGFFEKIKSCLKILIHEEVDPFVINLIALRTSTIGEYFEQKELFEMMPRFNEINTELANEIKMQRPDMLSTPH